MSKSLEELRAHEREATGNNVRIIAVDMSFGHVFTLVLKVWVSCAILTVPVIIALALLDVI